MSRCADFEFRVAQSAARGFEQAAGSRADAVLERHRLRAEGGAGGGAAKAAGPDGQDSERYHALLAPMAGGGDIGGGGWGGGGGGGGGAAFSPIQMESPGTVRKLPALTARLPSLGPLPALGGPAAALPAPAIAPRSLLAQPLGGGGGGGQQQRWPAHRMFSVEKQRAKGKNGGAAESGEEQMQFSALDIDGDAW